MMSQATPTASPAPSAAGRAIRLSPGLVRSIIRPRKPKPAASTSRWPPAISDHSSSGFTVHSRCARVRRAGSERSSQSRPRAIPANAMPFHSFSQRMICVTEVPPRRAAAHCSPVATGPYSDVR
jgi:hypothetical protein